MSTRVPCVDALGRAAQITLTPSGASLILRTPPGEAARLTPADTTNLTEALQTLMAAAGALTTTPTTVAVATVSTRHFTFHALGHTATAAREALLAA
jgi:hypothetical protein